MCGHTFTDLICIFGTLRLPTAAGAKTILRSSAGGFSWVLVDAEHGLINDSNYYEVRLLPSH